MTLVGDFRLIVRRDPCAYCGAAAAHADHIQARSRAGADEWENLTGACRHCNQSKSDRSLLAFLAGVRKAEPKVHVNLTMPGEMLKRIDAARGDVPRIRWIRRAVEDFVSSERESKNA